MGGFVLLGLLALGAIFSGPVALVMAASGRRRNDELGRAVADLQRQVLALKRASADAAPTAPAPPSRAPAEATPQERPIDIAPARAEIVTPRPARAAPQAPQAPRQAALEQQFGGKAFVWLGGVALALAGFFLVKYSIETGLLDEKVRVVLGVLFGLALLAGSQAVRRRKQIADGTRIAQALAGAGIAVLYGSFFAATSLYHLLPGWLGFAAMAAVTLTALILSLRHGAPIAALGLVGGYATPLMIKGEPNAPLLFAYLYLVFGGLFFLIRRQHWSWLALPAVLVAFGWVGFWLLAGLAAQDGVWLALFLVGVAATAVLLDRDDARGPERWLRYLAPAGSLVLAGFVTYAAHYGRFEWAMFGLLSVGAMVLAWFDNRTYALVPWLALLANLVMLTVWIGADPVSEGAIVLAFALLFGAGAQYFLPRSPTPLLWAGLSAAAALGYFLIGYWRLDARLVASLGRTADFVWAAVALALAGLLTLAVTRRAVLACELRLRQQIQAIFAATATALVSIGLAVALRQEYLPFAVAAELCALGWIGARVEIRALRFIAMALAALYAVLVVPDMFALLDPADAQPATGLWHQAFDVLFRFVLAGGFVASASYYFRAERDDAFVAMLEWAAVALFAAALLRYVRLVFAGGPDDFALLAAGIAGDLLLVLAYLALRVATWQRRPALIWAGIGLAGFAMMRLFALAGLIMDPLTSHQFIGPLPVANALVLVYALPAMACLVLARTLDRPKHAVSAQVLDVAAYVVGFVYLSLNVRQSFAGAYLDQAPIGNAEVYSYSAVWLVAGVALLFAAVLRKDFTMRVASLVVMLLTVGKVFLYDASELGGLWRVVSFLGLGLCLLGLSWFYSRFVFVTAKAPP